MPAILHWTRRASVILLTTFLASCGGPGTNGPAPLRVWIMSPGGDRPREIVDLINQRFTAAHPGVNVRVEFVAWADAKAKLKNAMLGGVAPDVCELGSTWTPEFAAGGALLDLTDRIAAEPWAADLSPALREGASIAGKLYGLPWYVGWRGLIYRKDWLADSGVPPPRTWQDWINAASAVELRKAGGGSEINSLGLPARSIHVFLPLIWSNGGEIMKFADNQWTPSLNTPESIEALRFIASLNAPYQLLPDGAKSWTAADARTAFATDKVAMIVDGPWAINSILEHNPGLKNTIGVVPVPQSQQYATFAGGSHLTVFQSTRQPDNAWAYVRQFMSDENLGDWCASVGFFPGRPSLTKSVADRSGVWSQEFASMEQYGRTYPPVPAWGKFEEAAVFETMAQKLFDGVAPEEVARWTDAEMTRIMSGK